MLLWKGVRNNDFSPNINVLWDKTRGVEAELTLSLDQFTSLRIDATTQRVDCALGSGVRTAYRLALSGRSFDVIGYLVPDGAGGTYIASYTRLAGDLPDKEAVFAVTGICKRSPLVPGKVG